MLWTVLDYLCTGLECFLQGSNNFCRVGMLSTELEYICTGFKCFQEGWNAFDSVRITLYSVGRLSTGLE
jgi:hypothetical protein